MRKWENPIESHIKLFFLQSISQNITEYNRIILEILKKTKKDFSNLYFWMKNFDIKSYYNRVLHFFLFNIKPNVLESSGNLEMVRFFVTSTCEYQANVHVLYYIRFCMVKFRCCLIPVYTSSGLSDSPTQSLTS